MASDMFTTRTPLSLAAWDAGPEYEVEMVVTFTVQPGARETAQSPAEPAFVEDVSIRLFSPRTKTELTCPTWLQELFADDDGFREYLLEDAREQREYSRLPPKSEVTGG